MLPVGLLSEDESEDKTPLSKRVENVQAKDVVLSKKNHVIDVPDSPEPKKRPAEGIEPSASKKQKVTRKGETTLKLVDPDDIDDVIDDIDLGASDDVRFPHSQDVRF